MRNAVILALGVISLTGCAVAHKTVMPDGRRGLSINCSGSAMAWNQCYEKAGKECPRGYDIISKDGDGGNGSVGGGNGFFAGGVSNTRSMMIACRG